MTLAELQVAVESEADAKDSVMLLIQGIVQILREQSGAEQTASVVDDLDASTETLATAVVAGTELEED